MIHSSNIQLVNLRASHTDSATIEIVKAIMLIKNSISQSPPRSTQSHLG